MSLQVWTGADLREWRKSMAMTQQDAADALEMSLKGYAKMERDDNNSGITRRTVYACLYLLARKQGRLL